MSEDKEAGQPKEPAKKTTYKEGLAAAEARVAETYARHDGAVNKAQASLDKERETRTKRLEELKAKLKEAAAAPRAEVARCGNVVLYGDRIKVGSETIPMGEGVNLTVSAGAQGSDPVVYLSAVTPAISAVEPVPAQDELQLRKLIAEYQRLAPTLDTRREEARKNAENLDEQIKALEADTSSVDALQDRVTRMRADTTDIDAATKALEEFKASYTPEQIAAEEQEEKAAKQEERRRGAMGVMKVALPICAVVLLAGGVPLLVGVGQNVVLAALLLAAAILLLVAWAAILQGKTDLDPKTLMASGIGRVGLGAVAVVVVLSALFGSHVLCMHEWDDATCTEPRTCAICGQTDGEALGHAWKDATCTKPKTCSRCGTTEGEALGHDWADATCTEPKKCKRCGETTGSALGHDVQGWSVTQEATCTAVGSQSGTCVRCGQTVTQEIPMTEHTPGDWVVTEESTVSTSGYVTPGTRQRACTVCGKVLDTESYSLDVTTSQVNALRRAASYLDYMAFSYKSLIDQLEFEGYSTEDATFAADHCGADWNVQAEKKAENYMSFMSFSRSGLINQLEFEGFTPDQAAHGADSVGL